MDNNESIKLRIGGTDYIGFETASVSSGIEQATSSFRLTMSLNEIDADISAIIQGAEVQLFCGKDAVLSGSIDSIEESIGQDAHSFEICGRSHTKDLVDCSAQTTAQFKKQQLSDIVKKLSSEYGVNVELNGDDMVIDEFQVEQNGETVFSALQRLAEKAKLYITDDARGTLILSSIGGEKTKNTIVRTKKENTRVLTGTCRRSEDSSYSKVIVKAQQHPTDDTFGKSANQVLAESVNKNAKRDRVKLVVSDTALNKTQAQALADWELKASLGRSASLKYTVAGWRGNSGDIWRHNTLVSVNDEFFGVAETLVISSVEMTIDNDGSYTSMLLSPSSAYDQKPIIEPTKAAKKNTESKMKIWTTGDTIQ